MVIFVYLKSIENKDILNAIDITTRLFKLN